LSKQLDDGRCNRYCAASTERERYTMAAHSLASIGLTYRDIAETLRIGNQAAVMLMSGFTNVKVLPHKAHRSGNSDRGYFAERKHSRESVYDLI